MVDLVAAHATEVVPLGAEEQPIEREPRGVEIGRVARPEQRIDLRQGDSLSLIARHAALRLRSGGLVLLDDGFRRIFRDRVLDERRLGAARGHEDVHLRDVGLPNLLDHRVVEHLPDFGDRFTVRVDDVESELAALRSLT